MIYVNDFAHLKRIIAKMQVRHRGRVMPQAAQPFATEIARKEIALLLGLAEQAGVDDARLRDELHLSQSDWQQWLGVLHDAPLPSRPALPQLLRHMGYVTSRLEREARVEGPEADQEPPYSSGTPALRRPAK